MKRLYRVTGIIKKNRAEIRKAMDLQAENQREAVRICRERWDGKSHLFHVSARRLLDTEEFLYHYWKTV